MSESKLLPVDHKQVDDAGTFSAIVATLGVVDHDGDIVESGAMLGSNPVPIVPSHQHGHVPLGKVNLEEQGDKVLASGRFNLDVAPARDWFSAIRFDLENAPPKMEYSWAFHIKSERREDRDGKSVRILEKVDLIEVSPVLQGASIGTRTVVAKSAIKSHETETSEAPWDGPANERRLKSPLPGEKARAAYAWIRPGSGEKSAGDAQFLHHFVDADGEPGPASTRACIAGIAALKGARGGSAIPEADRRGVYEHLVSHLEDAGIEPPKLEESGLTVEDQVKLALWDGQSAILRIREISDARQKRGQDLSDSLKAMGLELAATLEELSSQTKAIAAHCSPDDPVSRAVSLYAAQRARSVLG